MDLALSDEHPHKLGFLKKFTDWASKRTSSGFVDPEARGVASPVYVCAFLSRCLSQRRLQR